MTVDKFLPDSNLPEIVKSGVIWHPSVQLEEPMFGGNTEELLKRTQRPIVFMPAGNDHEGYRAEGNFLAAVKEVQPLSESIYFPDMSHGWTVRGDLEDPNVKRDVEAAINKTIEFFGKTV